MKQPIWQLKKLFFSNDMHKVKITVFFSCVKFKTYILKMYLSSVIYKRRKILRKSLKSKNFEFYLDSKWIRNELPKFLFSQRKYLREASKLLINVWNSWVSATCHTWQFSFYLCNFRFCENIVKTNFISPFSEEKLNIKASLWICGKNAFKVMLIYVYI